MCLDKVRKHPPKETSGFGYKCVSKVGDGFDTLNQHFPIHPKNWNKEAPNNIGWKLTTDFYPFIQYPAGFHIWISKRAAKRWCRECMFGEVVKVEYRDALCIGTQTGHVVIVANQFRIVKEE